MTELLVKFQVHIQDEGMANAVNHPFDAGSFVVAAPLTFEFGSDYTGTGLEVLESSIQGGNGFLDPNYSQLRGVCSAGTFNTREKTQTLSIGLVTDNPDLEYSQYFYGGADYYARIKVDLPDGKLNGLKAAGLILVGPREPIFAEDSGMAGKFGLRVLIDSTQKLNLIETYEDSESDGYEYTNATTLPRTNNISGGIVFEDSSTPLNSDIDIIFIAEPSLVYKYKYN